MSWASFEFGDLRALYEEEIKYRSSTRFQSDKEYWTERLAGVENDTSLSRRNAGPAAFNHVSSGALSAEMSELVDEAVDKHDATLATLLIGGFAAYLAQVIDTDDVVLSLPVTARTTAFMRRCGGMVSNIVPLRLQVGYDDEIGSLLKAVRVAVTGTLRHQRYRHEDIRRDTARSDTIQRELFGPLVNVMLFHNEIVCGSVVGQFTSCPPGS